MRTSQAAALRAKCQQALGPHFPNVYAFLRKTRTQDGSSVGELKGCCCAGEAAITAFCSLLPHASPLAQSMRPDGCAQTCIADKLSFPPSLACAQTRTQCSVSCWAWWAAIAPCCKAASWWTNWCSRRLSGPKRVIHKGTALGSWQEAGTQVHGDHLYCWRPVSCWGSWAQPCSSQRTGRERAWVRAMKCLHCRETGPLVPGLPGLAWAELVPCGQVQVLEDG